MTLIKPAIFGISGTIVTDEDREFFKEVKPYGFAIFKKNTKDKRQLTKLCEDLRNMLGRFDAPILIDQEGGNVFRLSPPIWRTIPSPLSLAKFAYGEDDQLEKTLKLVRLNTKLVAIEMLEVGINANCYPVADLLIEGAHTITAERSFGPNHFIVSTLVNTVIDTMNEMGAISIIKHMLGQGRAKFDSHLTLPKVEEKLNFLEQTDFDPFKKAMNAKWGMPAHINYSEFNHSVTTFDPSFIKYIREAIGFSGTIISDCLTMKALGFEPEVSAAKAIEAGMDLIFYGGARYEILEKIAHNLPNLTEDQLTRLNQHNVPIKNHSRQNFEEIRKEFEQLHNEMISKYKIKPEYKWIEDLLENRESEQADLSSPLYKA